MPASGRSVPVIGDLAKTGRLGVGISSLADVDEAAALRRRGGHPLPPDV